MTREVANFDPEVVNFDREVGNFSVGVVSFLIQVGKGTGDVGQIFSSVVGLAGRLSIRPGDGATVRATCQSQAALRRPARAERRNPPG